MQYRRYLSIATISLLSFTTALAQQTDNYTLRAVPAPKTVAVDGRLDEWDKSGGILSCYDLAALRDSNSVETWAMFDAEALYLAFHFKDATPLVNHVNPQHAPGSGWRSDSVELRIKTDRVVNVECYEFSDEHRPACRIVYGLMNRQNKEPLDDALQAGAQAAFAKDADGRGYVQEVRLPWKLLRADGKAMHAGESLLCGLQFNWGADSLQQQMPKHRYVDLINREQPQREFFWGNPKAWGEVRLMEKGNLPPEPSTVAASSAQQLEALRYTTQGPVSIAYELPRAGNLTLVIEKPDGTRVRNLIADVPRKAGANVDHWDGTDDDGQLVPAGDYRWRGLTHDELDVRYQFAYGSPGEPAWETADGRGAWLSDHRQPFGVCADESGVFLSSLFAEGGSGVLAVDNDFRKQWGEGHNSRGGAMARLGAHLYVLSGGTHPALYLQQPGTLTLRRFDPKTGRYSSFADGKSDHVIFRFPEDRPMPHRLPEGEAVAARAFDAGWLHMEALGIAAAKDRLYVTLYFENKVLILDPETGDPVGEIVVEKPSGIAAGRDGGLFVLSGTKLLRVNDDGNTQTVVSTGLDAPVGLATDVVGNIYVSDLGHAMCVKVFTAAGKLLRTIGKVGGRALTGRYEPEGMWMPMGLAVDVRGRLWVNEYDFSPKRTSIWSPDGKLEREFCGPTWYMGTETGVNQLRPTQAFTMGNTVELDWQRGQWRVTDTLWRPTHPDALFGPYGESLQFTVRKQGGRELLIASGTYRICISELRDGQARPLMAAGIIAHYGALGLADRGFPIKEFVFRHLWDDPATLELARQKEPDFFIRGSARITKLLNLSPVKPRLQFLWTDANGDGLAQEPEIEFSRFTDSGAVSLDTEWVVPVGPDWALYLAVTGKGGPDGKQPVLRKVPVKEWNAVGAPVYDFQAEGPHLEFPSKENHGGWVDSRSNLLLNRRPMLTMFAPDGRELWHYPNQWPSVHASHTAPAARRGLLIGPHKVIGSAQVGTDEVFCMNGNHGQAFLMTTDGLFVSSLFRDARSAPDAMPEPPMRGTSVMGTTVGGEWFGGEFFRHPETGKIYIGASQAREASVLSEVTGLETLTRLTPQPLRFTPEQYVLAEQALDQRGQAAAKTTVTVPLVQKAPPLDGRGTGFDWQKATTWSFGDSEATAALARDEKTLHLAWRVKDATPMVNSGSDWKKLFKSGDALVFELGAGGRKNDTGGQIIPGDLRLLISVFEGQPIAVLYRYVVPGTKTPEEFSSPVGVTRIDSVTQLANAKLNLVRSGDGYTLEAAVRLADLGWSPAAGGQYRGDLGVIYSDQAGLRNGLRMHWSNKATGIISDLFSEAKIQPEQWGAIQTP